MPELCRFFGIIIRMYFDDHGPPHFHALYGGDEALIDIDTLAVLEGRLPPRAQGLVVEWGAQHRGELQGGLGAGKGAWSPWARSIP